MFQYIQIVYVYSMHSADVIQILVSMEVAVLKTMTSFRATVVKQAMRVQFAMSVSLYLLLNLWTVEHLITSHRFIHLLNVIVALLFELYQES